MNKPPPRKRTGNLHLDLPNHLFDTGLIRTVSHRELKTLLAFLQFADNHTGVAWPAIGTIATLIGTTPRMVRLAIRALERRGLLVTTRAGGGRGHSSTRRVTLRQSSSVEGQNPVRLQPETLLDSDRNPARLRHESLLDSHSRTYSRTSPLTYSGTSAENMSGLDEIPDSMVVPEFQTAWTEFLAHRWQLGKPMTTPAARRQLARLASLGPSRAVAAIHHSIENGWQGIFEPRGDNHEQRKHKPRADRDAGRFPEDLRL